jgi:predicted GNAT family acetyltransferase
MSDPIQGYSETAIIRAIERNAIDSVRDWGRWGELHLHESPEMTWFETGIKFPIFNGVLKARIAPEDIDGVIGDVIDRVQSSNVSMIWWMGPSTHPPDLGGRLEDRGFNPMGQAVGMAMDLRNINVTPGPSAPDLEVHLVCDKDELRTACDIVSTVNDFPDFAAEKWYEMHAALGLDANRPWRYYLALLDGKPVGTASLYLGKGVASIVSVSTLQAARGRGVGTAVSLKPFLDARQAGYHIATLCSSDMGQGVYRRMGFREYCSFGMYLWI